MILFLIFSEDISFLNFSISSDNSLATLYKKFSLIDFVLFSKIVWYSKYAFCSLAAKDALAAISEDSESIGKSTKTI